MLAAFLRVARDRQGEALLGCGERLQIVGRLGFGFNFAAPGTIVDGCDDFALWSVGIFDGFFGVPVHQCAAIWTAHAIS